MAPRPASNAAFSWAEVSSTTSRPRPRYSCAREWASFMVSCARFASSDPRSRAWRAQSVPFSRRISRVSSPVFGASRSAAAAPMRAPTASRPSAPRKFRSSRSSLMVLLLAAILAAIPREAVDEYVDALLNAPRDADHAADGPEARQEARQIRHPGQDVLGHDRDALDLAEIPGRLLGEGTVLLEERLDLGGEGLQFVVDRDQRLLRRARRPGHLEEGR